MLRNPIDLLASPRIRVVVAEPQRRAEIRMIERDLAAMQEIVGGYIEMVSLGGLDVYFNEEGRVLGLPHNRVLGGYEILGTLFVSRTDDRGESVSLTKEQAERVVQVLDAALGPQDPYNINPARRPRSYNPADSMSIILLRQIDEIAYEGGGWASTKRCPGGSDALWELESAGLIEEDGGYVRLTAAGRALLLQ